MHPPYVSKSNVIAKAASYARGDQLRKLRILCENQKTISTRKLELILDSMADDMKIDAIFLGEVSKVMYEDEKKGG